MRRRFLTIGGLTAAVAAGVLRAQWSRRQDELSSAIEQLDRAAEHAPVAAPADLTSAPAPVARYLRLAIRDPRPPRIVRLGQAGAIRSGPNARWMPFVADHVVAPHAAAFVWNARVGIAGPLHVRVRDALLDGSGSGQVALLSALTVASAAGAPELNSGELHRFLAEAVWYPTALLPGGHLRWTAIDDGRALATLTAHGTTVSLEFRFASSGEVTGIYTPARWGTFSGGYEQRPWEGHFRRYEARDGLLVPGEGDVGWYEGGAWRAVWRATITRYDAQRQAVNP